MNFMEAVQSAFSKYATFQGRAGRSEFWWFVLFSLIVIVVAGFLDGTFSNPDGQSGWLVTVLGIGLLLPWIAITVRRLHDRDMSGWWYLLNLIPVGGLVVLIICAMQGTTGSNRFGPPPLAKG